MPRPNNAPTTPTRKDIKHSEKNKNNNNIQAARLIKNTSNNSMLNSSDDNLDANWTQNINKRNHSDSSEPKTPDPTSNNRNYKKLFITANRYEVLTQTEPANPIIPDSNEASCASPESNTVNQIKPPPPIFVKGIINFSELCEALIEIIGVDNFYCKSSSDRLKIQTANPEAYRSLVHFLKEKNAQFHTYQLKEDKPTRVVIRNIHPSTPTELIKSELEHRLFEVRQITNVLHKTTKRPLPLFFVDLEPTEQSNDIFQLSSILHTKIKVEEPYKPKVISQCLNCQDYGHTRAYCGYPARCVRCSSNHPSSECTKSRDTPAKCVLCSGDHPANYRGCSVYKELQRRKTPAVKSNFLHDNIKLNVNNFNVKASHPLPNLPEKNITDPPKTYAKATSSHPSQSSPSAPSTDLTSTISSFVDELKSLVNPLIALLTQVITSLLNKKNE